MTAVVESRPITLARPSPSAMVRPQRRWSLLIGGLLLVLFCAGVFALIQSSGDARAQVLALARPVPAGQPLSADDLRAVQVVPGAGVRLISAVQLHGIVGRTAAVPLASGSLLVESQLGPTAWPQRDQAVVAAAFKPGALPAGLVPGSHTLVVTVVKNDIPAAPSSTSAPAPVAAMVVDIVAGDEGTGTTVVSLLLARADAATLAGAGADLSLVLVAG